MEPICWLGMAGIVGVAVALCGIFSKSCKGHDSSCGCTTNTDAPQTKENSSTKAVIDEQKEKAINDLIK